MKRILSLFLALALLVGNIPAVAYAEEENLPTEAIVAETTVPAEVATEPTTLPAVEETESAVETTVPAAAETEPAAEATEFAETEIQPLPESEQPAFRRENRTFTSDVKIADDDTLFAVYANHVLLGKEMALQSNEAGQCLEGDEKRLYDALVSVIKDIASGKRASASICVGKPVPIGANETLPVDVEMDFSWTDFPDAALHRVYMALLYDLAYEMYWHDKTTGVSMGAILGQKVMQLQLDFTVAENYRGGDIYTANTAKTGAASTAAGNARSVVTKYQSASDYQKLVGYRDEICTMVSYDHAAADAGNFAQNNDPWQLISVFDGNSTTNVVCEGYSKAFKYLCDLSDFSGNVTCYTVTGYMSGGNHMWNIVTLENANYLVDVTNSDSGTVGQNGGLFLAGASGSADIGYLFLGYSFIYDAESKALWGTGANSILTLAPKDYEPGKEEPGEAEPSYVASGTCGENLTWTLDDRGKLTISGTGAVEDYDSGWDAPWRTYSGQIKTLEIQEGVTGIGGWAFWGLTELTSVTLGKDVARIGFAAFEHCESLKEVRIPAGVSSIQHSAFCHCYKLERILVDDANSKYCSDASGALYTKDGKELVQLPGAYSGNYVIPDGVTSIKWYAFAGCRNLTGVEIPDSVTELGEGVFEKCTSLTSVTIPDSVTELWHGVFEACTALKSIVIPAHVSKLGTRAFYGCSNLTQITFTGDAPEFFNWNNQVANDSFYGVRAKVYYPLGNATWTADVRQNYGGDIQWVPYHTNHNYITIPGVAPTCTEPGLTEGKKCADCGDVQIPQEIIPKLGHDYVTTVVNPTPTEYGYLKHVCSRCGDTYRDNYTNPLGPAVPVIQVRNDAATGDPVVYWNPAEAADRYLVFRSTSKTKGYTQVADIRTTVFQDTTAALGKTYYYKLKSYNETVSMASQYSEIKSGKSLYPQPAAEITNNTSGYPVIKWGKVSGAKKYDIYYASTQNGTYKKLASTSSTSYTHSKAAMNADYFYQVRAYGSSASYAGAFSVARYGTRKLVKPSITLTVNHDTSSTKLTWKKISYATGYEIQCSVNGGAFQTIQSQTGLSFTHSNLVVGNTYRYRVRAVCGKVEATSPYSAEKAVTVQCGKPVLTTACDGATGKAVLTWKAIKGAETYTVYRSTNSSKSYKEVATVTQTTFTDTAAGVGKTYYYKVIASGANTKSAYSSYKKLTAKCPQPEVTVAASAAGGKPVIQWNKVSGGKKYEVYRSTALDGTYKKVKTTSAASYTDTSAKVGITYYYKVKAIASKSGCNSVYSQIKSCLTVCAQPVVTAKTVAATGKPILSWKAVTGATGYEIYRAVNGGAYQLVAVQSVCGYADQNTTVDGKYSYKVKAIGAIPALNSAEGNPVTIAAACGAPVITIALNGKKPMVSWGTVTGAVRFDVYRSTKKSSGFKKIAAVDSGASYTDTTARKGTTYYYKVIAVSNQATSAYSNCVKIKSK